MITKIRNFKSKVCLLMLLLFSNLALSLESDYFVTTWNPTFAGVGNYVVTIPTKPGLTYNYSVDWDNDGIFDEFNVTGDATHSYGLPGAKTIRIVGNFPRIFINNGSERLKILSIDQWGTNPWTSMRRAFWGAENLVNNATDTPNLINVAHLHAMFKGAIIIDSGTADWNWDTSMVTDMSNMFQNTDFNRNIGSWDTSSVTTFKEMFSGATSFNRDLGNWNVEASTDFTDMFLAVNMSISNYESLLISWANQNINNALTFNGGLSKYCSKEGRAARNSLINADGLSITDGGLCEAGYFISTWKTDNPGSSNSTSITIPAYLDVAVHYDYQVDWNGDGDFNDADENIHYSGSATHDYGSAGTYTVKIKGIFPRIYFNNSGDKDKILSIEQWGTNAWTSMQLSFWGASNLIINANDMPDLSAVVDLSSMFYGASNLGNGSGNWNWDVSTITLMQSMFVNASSFNKDISAWNTNNVINMQNMFANANSFNQDLSGWNVENVVNSFGLFLNYTAYSTINYDKLLIAWDAQNLVSGSLFTANNLQYCSQAAQDARASIIANYGWTFSGDGLDPTCDTSNPLNHFVITVDTTIAGATGSNSFSIPTTGTGYNYSIDSNNNGSFNFTGVTGNMQLNYATGGIKTIRIAGDFPRIYFNQSGDKDKILSIEQWGTIHWTSMNNAFSGASNLVINATDTPDLSNVSSLFSMFLNASNIGNGTGNWNWDTSNIAGMANMFQNATSFDKDISSWNIENVGNVGAMFSGATLSDANYDALLISWDAQNVQPSLVFNGGNSQYCSPAAVTAHDNLINNDLWTITDAGYNSACNSTIDLQVQITDGTSTVNPGDLHDYTIQISNNGASDAVNAIIQDLLPAEIVATTWICNSAGGAFCPASGSGSLNETVNIPAGVGSLTYTVSATISNTSFAQVEYSARAIAGGSQVDSNTTNNIATDINTNADIIFSNGFEVTTMIVKTTKGQIKYDFSQLPKDLSVLPYAIVRGVDENADTNLWIHVRKIQGQIQIRLSNKDENDAIWRVGQWQVFDTKQITSLYW